MRGDSLRDLYAKALALLGLGMLAGTGALVDHWPLGESLPSSASVSVTPEPPRLASSVIVGVEAHDTVGPQHTPVPERTAFVGRRSALPAAAPPRPTQVEQSSLELVVPAEVTSDAVEPEPLLVTTVARIPLRAPSTTLQRPESRPSDALTIVAELSGSDDYPPIRTALASGSGEDSGDGLITGAFKKTGSSLVRTGARTGASIFDAVRAVSGVVRRALPVN